MAITFRNVKQAALTHDEMDTNLASYYLSSSVSGNIITFFRSGSNLSGAATVISTSHTLPGGVTYTNVSEFINDVGYITGSADNLQDVTSRGSITSTTITAANFITTSDRRLKSDIEPLKNGLDTIKKFVSYEYVKDGVQDAGFIAQEVQEAIPYAIAEGEDGFLTMRDRPELAYMHKAILELEARLAAIEEKL